MSARLFDPDTSQAVFIGVSNYSKLLPIGSVRTGLRDLAEVFIDPKFGRLPSENLTVVENPSDGNEVGKALKRAAQSAEDMLLVYYAGHGLTGLHRRDLYLSLVETDPDYPAYHSISYDVIREEVLDSAAKCRVVILDCCFSGRATSPVLSNEHASLVEELKVDGAYVLTASPANKPALAGKLAPAFTRALVETLRNGIAGGPELVTLDVLYHHVRRKLESQNMPKPSRLTTDGAGKLAFTVNHAYSVSGLTRESAVPEFTRGDSALNSYLERASLDINRRNLILLNKMTQRLDLQENQQEDPELLRDLFQIDHLVTRMRRNERSILVLAGKSSIENIEGPVPIIEILRASCSQIEQYTRIKFGPRDVNPSIDSAAVGDLIHLFAELLENATQFSPLESVVNIATRRVNDNISIRISDSGIGMPEDYIEALNSQINERIASSGDARKIGLRVVSILANRHSIRVQLERAGLNMPGVNANITIPNGLLRWH